MTLIKREKKLISFQASQTLCQGPFQVIQPSFQGQLDAAGATQSVFPLGFEGQLATVGGGAT